MTNTISLDSESMNPAATTAMKISHLASLRRLLAASVAAVCLGTVCAAQAAYPDKPIKIIVSSAAGGYLDVITRAVGAELQKEWKQPVVIENKPGASGVIGAVTVQKSDADGYTWLAATEAHLITNKYTQKSLPYEYHRDFTGVSILAKADQVIVATKDFPANTLPELIALARKTPEGLSYGSWGIGSHPHLLFSRLGGLTNTNFVMIPYKGVAPTLQALNGGEVRLSVMSIGTAKPFLDSGRLKVLASASKTRSDAYPAVPTTAELGYPDLRSTIYMVLLLPKETPREVVDKASSTVQAIVRQPEFTSKVITGHGFQLVASDSRGVEEALDELEPLIGESVKAAHIVGE